MKQLCVFEWNVKNMNNTQCHPCVAGKILNEQCEPDVLFFCEYNNFGNSEFEKKISDKYRIISLSKSKIMIAINKQIKCAPGPARVIDGLNFLAKKIMIGEKIITLVGARIQINSGNASNDEQLYRKKQLEQIISQLKNDKNVIIMGDFNNYKLHGNENEINDYDQLYKDYEQKLYNLQIVKEMFANSKYKYINSTPQGDTYSYKLGKAKYKYDHIFVKGDLSVESVSYDWEWEEGLSKTKGYNPDHALLKALVKVL